MVRIEAAGALRRESGARGRAAGVRLMRRYGWLAAVVILGLAGCREEDGPLGGDEAGVLVVRSDPAGGAIRLDDRATGRVTPDTLRGTAGLHQVVVELDTVQLKYRYSAQVVVPPTGEPLTLDGPLMARCQGAASDCAGPFRLQYQLGTVRFAANALGPFFLQAGQGQGLYWPAASENSYISTATPVFGAKVDGTAVSTGIYDMNFFAGRPAPLAITASGQFTLSQTTWILPPAQVQQFVVVRGLEVRERLLTTTSADAVFLIELTYRNISNSPLYAIVDPGVGQVGVTFEDAYIGLAVDPDIGSNDSESDDDRVTYDAEAATVYAYDAGFLVPGFTVNQNSPGLVGLRVLERPAGTAVSLNAWTRQTAVDWQGGTTTQVAGYGMLSGLQSYTPDHPGTTIGHLPESAGDVRMVAAVGPLRLAPGDSARVVLAVAIASPSPGTFTSGTNIAPGNPEDTSRQIHAVAGQLRATLATAGGLLTLRDQ